MDARLQGCRGWSCVGNKPLRKAGQGVKGWQGLADGALGCRCCVLAFPLCGNGLFQLLGAGQRRNDDGGDSGFWRNDGEGCGPDFFRNGKGFVGMARNSL